MAIDLSRIAPPAIDGLVLTLDAVHGQLLQALADGGWKVTAQASDPAWRLTRLLAGREVLLRQAVADAVRQTSLAYAAGTNLDSIGATYYALDRHAGETDDAYRARLAAAFERYAIGLSGPWYESLARGVAGVADARVTTPVDGVPAPAPQPGEVHVWILADGALTTDAGAPRYPDGIPDQALLDAVTAVVTADDARQQTDRVSVLAATRFRYDVTAVLTLRPGPDAGVALAAARARLQALTADQARLGAGVTKALVAGAVVDPAAVTDCDITFTERQVPVHASRTFGAGEAALTVTAMAGGPAGNAITVRLARGGSNQALAVELATDPGTAITAYLGATGGVLTTTAAELVAALNADADVAAVVTAALPETANLHVYAAVVAARAGGYVGTAAFEWGADPPGNIRAHLSEAVLGGNPPAYLVIELDVHTRNIHSESRLARASADDVAGATYAYHRAPGDAALEYDTVAPGDAFTVSFYSDDEERQPVDVLAAGAGVVAVVDPAQALAGGSWDTRALDRIDAADGRAPLAVTLEVTAA